MPVEVTNGDSCIIFKSWMENPEINAIETIPQTATGRNTLEARGVVQPKPGTVLQAGSTLGFTMPAISCGIVEIRCE